MIDVYETAIRAWVNVPRKPKRRIKRVPWRTAPFGKRVLIFDTETTTDHLQRLLFGVCRLYESGRLVQEAVFTGDSLHEKELAIIIKYAEREGLRIQTRMAFCKEIFYPEIYLRGTLCVGFNLPFDLSRIAMKAGSGRGKNRHRFRFQLTDWHSNPAIYVQAISGKAAFIEFALKKHLSDWEKPFFKGRFLDLSTLANALTARRFSLKRAAIAFRTAHRKSAAELGVVSPEALDYCRNDVLVTAELYERIVEEYLRYPFASMENERSLPPGAVPITRLYSTASIAKATLGLLGIKPLGERQFV
jgi:hypothetical protein